MKRDKFMGTVLCLAVLTLFASCAGPNAGRRFSFMVTSDQRYHAAEPFLSKEYTLGGYAAIKKVGQGSFMVVVGDMNPAQATDDLIEDVFGEAYPWYPVVGNHDFEDLADIQYIESLNRREGPLPNVVRKGPAGCEETTYSFDWDGVHFVVLNVFFDGMDGNLTYTPLAPGLLAWLEKDLEKNRKKPVFIFGHKPIFPILDMDNGTQRHVGECLDRYPENSLVFQRLLLKYGVKAYISGHTHTASWANMNGVWHINSGHIYGQEGDYTPEKLLSHLSRAVDSAGPSGVADTTVIRTFFESNPKEMRRIVFSLDPIPGKEYKVLTDGETIRALCRFYQDCMSDSTKIDSTTSRFWKNVEWRKSTFLKLTIRGDSAVLEIYRDTDFTGDYELRHTQILW